jgi:hypothetical protein
MWSFDVLSDEVRWLLKRTLSGETETNGGEFTNNAIEIGSNYLHLNVATSGSPYMNLCIGYSLHGVALYPRSDNIRN